MTVGKDTDAFAHALVDMEIKGADRTEVKTLTMDMSRSYISAAIKHMAQAKIVFDRFHIVKKMNEAVDAMRKSDRKKYIALNKIKYL